MSKSKAFRFDGGAGTYLGTGILAFLITVITFGIYGFWVGPRVQKRVVENTDFDSAYVATQPVVAAA